MVSLYTFPVFSVPAELKMKVSFYCQLQVLRHIFYQSLNYLQLGVGVCAVILRSQAEQAKCLKS